MKQLILLLLVLSFVACKSETKEEVKDTQEAKEQTADFNWLVGEWKRIGEKEGKQTYEYWKNVDQNAYKGLGCTIQNGDTIWREDIMLSSSGTSWNFAVTTIGDSVATVFKLTEIKKGGFVCENEMNEFPKKIEYARAAENLNALISGGGPNIAFNFVPLNK